MGDTNMNTKVVNLFGGPGVGKSVLAAGLTYEIASRGVHVELVDEFAKQLTWEDRRTELENQVYVFAQQHRKIQRLVGKVPFVVTDSPLLSGIVYTKPGMYLALRDLVEEVFDYYENINFF